MADTDQIVLREKDLDLLEKVQEGLLKRKAQPPQWREITPDRMKVFRDAVEGILIMLVQPAELKNTAERLSDALVGIGLLQPFLRDTNVDEIYVRGEEIAVERGGKLVRHVGSAPESYWKRLIERVADLSGRQIEPGFSAVLIDLPDGARFTGMLPPIMDAPAINIRVFRKSARSFENLRKLGTFGKEHGPSLSGNSTDIIDDDLRAKVDALPDQSLEKFLAWVVAAQTGNVMVAGQFSSGKTTLLNAISSYVPPTSPVAVLETFRELQLSKDLFTMRAIAPSDKDDTGMTDRATMEWVLNTIYTRANPGAIILGEIVSPGEAMQFLKAANLGRRAYSTIHGGTVGAALGRLETLALGNQPNLGLRAIRRMVADGLDIVVLMNRRLHKHGAYRYVADVVRVVGVDETGEYILDTLYQADAAGDIDPVTAAWSYVKSETEA
jgi:Flp pilus assembly CpaF family ATPase